MPRKSYFVYWLFLMLLFHIILGIRTWAAISYTIVPETITVGLTGKYFVAEWIANGSKVLDVATPKFKDYIKDVMAEEWYDVGTEPAHAETIKTGAVVSKIFA